MGDFDKRVDVDWLRANLEAWQLPPAAIAYILGLWDAIQAFDDFADGDEVERPRLDALIWNTLIGLPHNPFFQAHSGVLLPVTATQILKWQASDAAERAGNADAMSFVWRAGFYDVVLVCIQLVHGTAAAQAAAPDVMRLYGEKFADYLKEFENA